MPEPDFRSARHARFYRDILHGRESVNDVYGFKRFLEGLFTQEDPVGTVEKLIASPNALAAIRNGLRLDITPVFINKYTARFVRYLNDPKVKLLCNGQFLEQLLVIIVEPRTVWAEFLKAFSCHELDQDAIHALAWLTTELLALPKSSGVDIRDDAHKFAHDSLILNSSSMELQNFGHRIKFLLQMKSSDATISQYGGTAGGHHDNDFLDFRQIAVLPTAGEFLCTEKPFYRRADEILELKGDERVAAHLDNQFRLLREDMLSELRDDVQVAQGKKKGRRSKLRLGSLSLYSIYCRSTGQRRFSPFSIGVSWKSGLESFQKMKSDDRKVHLKNNSQILKHKALGCLLRGDEIIAFASIDRDIETLALPSPVLKLHVIGEQALKNCLLYLRIYKDVDFLLVEAPVFAYEPILKRLQGMVGLPLKRELFLYDKEDPITSSGLVPLDFVQNLETMANKDISSLLRTASPVRLDQSQLRSLLAGLTQNVSLIQGPPGTGKSFIGALLTKVFHDRTQETILVMCYTNHALDQFLEDLLDIGIDASSIVRLGSKSTQRTRPLAISEQRSNFKRSRNSWDIIGRLENTAIDKESELVESFMNYKRTGSDVLSILEYLEFEDVDAFEALSLPDDSSGMEMVGKQGKTLKEDYLYARWVRGEDAGVFKESLPSSCAAIWELSKNQRLEKHNTWIRALLEEHAESLGAHASQFNRAQKQLDIFWGESNREILKTKRIIGCTTTGAAMYFEDIGQTAPGVVLLEEAGEILEPHVLAALTQETKQLVLIGDHLQLRPKVNSYNLTTEKGDGYDLNISLFERLIHVGYPHTTLSKQHRMCPEISTLVRGLMYPSLEDDEKTTGRPAPRGLQDRVIFIQHNHPEVNFAEISDRRDEGSKQSKRNIFEAELVLKIVKYLGQQGYGTDRLVVLTPYLGQLHLLRDELSKQNDPVLNDLDSYDLVRAGLVSQANARHAQRPIKLSTIDNYQGEESEVVIASLTRSNKQGDIGFMAAPERVNVLLSRARDILIIVGNSETFLSSRKGHQCWSPLFDQLKSNGHIYDGLPVRCEQHPQVTRVIGTPLGFDQECPDGGCAAPCGVELKCAMHECPYKCHQLSDHSQMECRKPVVSRCSRGHVRTMPCYQTSTACRSCLKEDQAQQRRRERDARLDAERQRKQTEYALKLEEAQAEIAYLRKTQNNAFEDVEHQRILHQCQQEIEDLKKASNFRAAANAAVTATNVSGLLTPADTVSVPDKIGQNDQEGGKFQIKQREPGESETASPSKDDWEYQKQFLNAQSDEIDRLMELIGLESVKEKFLAIKAKVDISISQNVTLDTERFGTVFMGNPGTGKTTVARLYAKFLASVGVIPGSELFETNGSKLANDGVTACQKALDKILEKGGGAFFIDEAYQLTQGQFGGTQVLDFLLAEIENLTGKIVFILAGYQRPMEKFFGHNLGLKSRFPHELKFNDYTDGELLEILGRGIQKKWRQQMKVEDGLGGLYCRIAARRIGSGRGKEGFGNARAMENAISKFADRQSARVKREKRQSGMKVDTFLLTKDDIIGPEPSRAVEHSNAWRKLNEMIGLDTVKDSVKALLGTIHWNYERELIEQSPVEYSLNKVFLGSPGTGKTTVAKLYGQILVDIGMLSNGEVVVKNPSDFVGSAVGESEKNTKSILAATVGKVLVIDEAYGLFGGGTSDGTGARSDMFRSAVVDTIVAEVQSTPGEDRCVLLLGYNDQMRQMFQHVNPGMSRRFPMDQAFVFEDFTKEQMDKILSMKLKVQDLGITDIGRRVVHEMVERSRNRLNFGNAGEIDIILNSAKMRLQKRIASTTGGSSALPILDATDFDEEFDRADKDEPNVRQMFEGVVGCDECISKLEGYQRLVKRLRNMNVDPRDEVPFNFLFRGPPGTGKTSTARKMGQIYYDMGLLSSADVVESSATDLVGQYVGQTGPKTQKLLESALGRVLFIDEAYRLADGRFGQEAMDELVDSITKPAFFHKMIIILAGYDKHLNELMATNPGLTSRFPEALQFYALSSGSCIRLLTTLLSSRKKSLQERGKVDFDMSALEQPVKKFIVAMGARFEALSHTPGWANARDVETTARTIFNKALQTGESATISVSENQVLEALDDLLSDRTSRGRMPEKLPLRQSMAPEEEPLEPLYQLPTIICADSISIEHDPDEEHTLFPDPNAQVYSSADTRDAGVDDEVWQQLQQDKVAALALEQGYSELQKVEAKQRQHVQKLTEALATPANLDDNTKRLHEQARLRRDAERREQEAILEKLVKEKAAREEMRCQEERKQQKLREMGVCPVGYRWIKSKKGYRCAGGSHFVSDAQLA